MEHTTPKIYGAIAAIMADVEPIAKDRKNQQQGFQYRGIDDVMNALQPILAKHKVFPVPEVMEHIREERTSSKGATLLYSIAKIKYTLYAEDGSSVSAVMIGEGMDSGDKATNKAMSVAMKYALLQMLCIPTEDAKDPDAETHAVQPNEAPKAAQAKAQDKPAVPYANRHQVEEILKAADGDKEIAAAAVKHFGCESAAKIPQDKLQAIVAYAKQMAADADNLPF